MQGIIKIYDNFNRFLNFNLYLYIMNNNFEFLYVRQFYPLNKEYIEKTKFGNYIDSKDLSYEDELEVEELLNSIKCKFDIPYKIQLRSNSIYVDKYPELNIVTQLEIGDMIKKFAKNLVARGKEQKILIKEIYEIKAFTLIILQNGKIEWYIMGYDEIIKFLNFVYKEGSSYIINFLKRLASEPKIYPGIYKIRKTKELEIIFKLTMSGKLGEGRELLEVPVGKKRSYGRKNFKISFKKKGLKRIDLVYETKDAYWLIEAKRKLNWDAVGQILCKKIMFEEDYNIKTQERLSGKKKEIRIGICCEKTDETIEQCCMLLGIEVFVI